MATIGRQMVLAVLCMVLGNFVLFHDRERIVMAQFIEDETSLHGWDVVGDSPKGLFERWYFGKQQLRRLQLHRNGD